MRTPLCIALAPSPGQTRKLFAMYWGWPRLELPVVEDVRFEGWQQWHELEKDLWLEEAALRRKGWSEVRWRQWLRLLEKEAAMRREWWGLVQQWSQRRWSGHVPPLVGGDSREEAVWEAMRDEEAARRLWWNWWSREDGWGDESMGWLTLWEGKFFEWGLEEEVEAMKREFDLFGAF